MESISLKLRGSGIKLDDLTEVVFTSDTSNVIKHNTSVNKTWQNCVRSNVSEEVIQMQDEEKENSFHSPAAHKPLSTWPLNRDYAACVLVYNKTAGHSTKFSETRAYLYTCVHLSIHEFLLHFQRPSSPRSSLTKAYIHGQALHLQIRWFPPHKPLPMSRRISTYTYITRPHLSASLLIHSV